MKRILAAFGYIQGVMAAMFAIGGLALTYAAAKAGWDSISSGLDVESAQQIIEAIGLLAAAVVALQTAQTLAEEEVIRAMHVSAPTRVRRFLSRFLVVLVVALVIEGLVATFKAVHDDLAQLPYASAVLVSAAVLLAAWGVFIKLNRAAEELEPQKMEQAKKEDEKLE
jgi:hypothetical protein